MEEEREGGDTVMQVRSEGRERIKEREAASVFGGKRKKSWVVV